MQSSLIDSVGGETAVRALVERFYEIMDSEPSAAPIRAMHPADLSDSIDKLTWFLIGFMGGPPEYIQRFGHPRLRMRHMPFAIDESARDQWLECMGAALDEQLWPAEIKTQLMMTFVRVANHMRNQPGPT